MSESCDAIRNNIYFFDDLDDKEKENILAHISYCSECKSHFQKINHLVSIIDNHINDQILIDYTLNNLHSGENSFNTKLTDHETERIEQHLHSCHFCKLKYIEMQSQYIEMNDFWSKAGYPDFEMQPIADKHEQIVKNRQKSFPLLGKQYLGNRYIQKIIAFAAVLLILVMSLIIDWTSPSLEDLAQLKDVRIPVSIRGGESNAFYKGIIFFNQKNYEKAIILFQQYIDANQEISNTNYARYLLALSYLKSANKDGIMDLSLVDKGISEFSLVLDLSINPDLIENAKWYLAKAYLMKKDKPQAIRYFKEVVALNGHRREESQLMLDQLMEN